MLDRWTLGYTHRILHRFAKLLAGSWVSANQLTVAGFTIGLGVLPALIHQQYLIAACCIGVNRLFDGLDGMVARLQQPTDAGAFLDIVFDFLFYGAVVLGFALADPGKNGVAAAFLLFSFIGTGSSFLAFAVLAKRRGIHSIVYPHKGIYYLGGLTEGTETILFFLSFCCFPSIFPLLAIVFGVLCLITTMTRIVAGMVTLRR